MKKTIQNTLFVMSLIVLSPQTVYADPPPWVPAHGYRDKHNKNKHDNDYRHEEEVRYYGIIDGHCNKEAIGTILGGTVGGVVGHEVSKDKTVGTIAGVLVGAVLGNVIGRSMDEADKHCTGHALEYAADHQTVKWSDSAAGINYNFTPLETYTDNNTYCRKYVVTKESDGRVVEEHGQACRDDEGAWHMIN